MKIRIYETGNSVPSHAVRWSIGPDDDPDASSPRTGLYGGTQSLNEYMGGYAASEEEARKAAREAWARRHPAQEESL
jgi:hypothetical protein